MSRVRRTRQEAQVAYDRLSRWYNLLAGASEEKYVHLGLEKLQAAPGERVLEIGFGTGKALVALARSVGGEGFACGVDISWGMCQVAQRRLQEAGCAEHVQLVCGDGVRLPWVDAAFDALFMSFTLELFDTPVIPAILGECRRALRPGGRMVVVALQRSRKPSLSVRIYEWVHEQIPKYIDCRPIYVQRLLEASDFHVVEIDELSMWTLPVAIVLAENKTEVHDVS
ncbi:MAG: methyltransferase domain-containing protein [Anaerolineae bacterium]